LYGNLTKAAMSSLQGGGVQTGKKKRGRTRGEKALRTGGRHREVITGKSDLVLGKFEGR